MNACMYVSVYVCVYVCMYACIYCIVFVYLYSASQCMSLSEAHPTTSLSIDRPTVSELTRRSATGNCEWRTCPKSLSSGWSDPPPEGTESYHWATTPHNVCIVRRSQNQHQQHSFIHSFIIRIFIAKWLLRSAPDSSIGLRLKRRVSMHLLCIKFQSVVYHVY